MRGGVSLAVWIGGACAEIDELRRSPVGPPPADDGRFWCELTQATGYDSVVVDIMAGASAGGLNGVLMAASQVYGVPFGSIRETWLNVGSTKELVRTKDRERDTDADLRWLSLFRGDGHMFASIVGELTELIDQLDGESRPPEIPRMDLRLSATHVEPIIRTVRSPADEELTERRFASEFRFRAAEQPWLRNDFPSYAEDGAPGRKAFLGHISRLALAARTTSSYPAAFEAAAVHSSRVPQWSFVDPEPDPSIDVDMGGIFADRREVESPFVVADGGIVDNIPLSRALDAVAAAPAEGPTDRYLVYLHPGAPNAAVQDTEVTHDGARRRSAVPVIKAVLGAKVVGEDIGGDIAAIDDYNCAIEQAVAVRRATFQTLTDRSQLMEASRAARRSYLTQRASEDSQLVKGLLQDPIGFLGDDPFPSTVGTDSVADARWRAPLAVYSLAQRDRLSTALYSVMANRLGGWNVPGASLDGQVFGTGALPIMRVTQALLEWARHVESHDPDVGSTVKQVLYRVLGYCENGIERPRRMAWVTLLATAPSGDIDMSAIAATTVGRLRFLTMRTEADARALTDALKHNDVDVLAAALVASHAALDDAVATAWNVDASETNPALTADVRSAIVDDVLVEQAEALRSAKAELPAEADRLDPGDFLEPGEYLHRVLAGPEPIDVATLAAIEIACYPEFATGTPGRRPIDFVRLSAANPTPLASKFNALELDAANGGLWWDTSNPGLTEQRGIHIELKLAGNELSNFSAFLRKEWRANDWMWGRLDAVPTLVDLLVTEDSITRGHADPASRVDAIRGLITESANEELAAFGAELWATYGARIQSELAAIERGDGPTLTWTRHALVARRQWEILSAELPGNGSVDDRIARYRTGAERINDAATRVEIRQRLAEIVDSASNVFLATIAAEGITRYGSPDQPTWRGRVVRFAFRRTAGFATKRLTR